jgi:hypothetical protein
VKANSEDALNFAVEVLRERGIQGKSTDTAAAIKSMADFARIFFRLYKEAKKRGKAEVDKFISQTMAWRGHCAGGPVRMLGALFIESGEPLPSVLRDWLVQDLRAPRLEYAVRGYWTRDAFIRITVHMLVKQFGMNATRGKISRSKDRANECGCSIVARALGKVGFSLSEDAVEKIWNRRPRFASEN